MSLDALIMLEKASKMINKRVVLAQVSMSVYPGEAIALMGPNGCGKSTLLKMLGGLASLSEGSRLTRKGQGLHALRIGYAPDHLPKLKFTAWEYLDYMGSIQGIPVSSRKNRIAELIQSLNLQAHAKQQMRFYSKGMLQKVNLMQALLSQPDLLLLDEPLGGLDSETQTVFEEVLRDLQQKGTAVVLAAHERGWASAQASRILLMSEGRVIEEKGAAPPLVAQRGYIVACVWSTGIPDERFAAFQFGNVQAGPEGIRTSYAIDYEGSDRFLQKLLEAGASIRSLTEARGGEIG